MTVGQYWWTQSEKKKAEGRKDGRDSSVTDL
jgi:hypothetical protein